MSILHLEIVAVAVGGAIGAVVRLLLNQWVTGLMPDSRFPLGILSVNVIGCFAIGVLFVLIVERGIGNELWRSLLMVGLLGSLTTFSTFSLQLVSLIESGEALKAAVYLVASVVLSVLATGIGIAGTRQLL
jgi:CrcB protein